MGWNLQSVEWFKRELLAMVSANLDSDGLKDTIIPGVKLFKVTEAIQCAPAVYEPAIIIILNGQKEAILNGKRFSYDNESFMSCTFSIPVEAGTPQASISEPLVGVYVSLDTRVMTELVVKLGTEATQLSTRPADSDGLILSSWNSRFANALYRLIQTLDDPVEANILGDSRLKEFYFAVLRSDAGQGIMASFNLGNDMARAIEYLTSNLSNDINIESVAAKIGMSRAVFHRKFKHATSMSPLQFVKSMRLNKAAMKIASGKTVSEAAMDVGYISASQFSREFKRLYGKTPKQWRSEPSVIMSLR